MVRSYLHFAICLVLLGSLEPHLEARTFVIPHILEKSGTISSTQYTFDTTLFLTYNASLHGGDGQSATVDLYLFDEQTGRPLGGTTGEVCAPCTFKMDAKTRTIPVRMEDLIITNGGGFDQPVKSAYGVVVVSGPGAEAVNLQGFVVNSHTSPFDVSVFGFEPQPISSPAARTVVFPHVLETSGRITSDTYALDTELHAAYVGGLPGTSSEGGAELKLYLYDQSGALMQSGTGTDVCAPCTFELGGAAGAQAYQTIVIDDLINAAGGFGSSSVRQGFAVISIGGADPGNVALQGFVVNSHTSPFDLSVFGFEPQPISAAATKGQARTFVLPHVLEKSGTIATTPYTFDTTVFATYTPGLAGLPVGSGATVSLYLYDNSGAPMTGNNGTPVCAPCTFDLGTGGNSPRKQSIRLEDLITAAGGFDTPVKQGFGVLVVGGQDPDGVNLQGFVVNSHTSAFDLSVFGFNPEEVHSSAARAFVIPHILEKQGLTTDTQFTFDTTLFASYAGGLTGGIPGGTAPLNLYLFDSDTGLPLTGAVGEVCNPCLFELSSTNRNETITIEDLIQTRGGGFGPQTVRNAFGVLTIGGDAANVGLETFVVNAHTSPFDLSVFGFEPQPIEASRLVPMNIQITTAGGRPALLVPTLLGGEYVIEAKQNLDDDWLPGQSFTGDGTTQTIPLPPSGATRNFYRVRGS